MTLAEEKNINENELAKFSELAVDWLDPDGTMKPLHQINPIRLDYIQQQANLTHQHVLDVGCGGGILSEALAKEGAIVTGIDMSQDLITLARNHAEQQKLNINYQCQDIEAFTKTGVRFDIVTCMELLEHVPDPRRMIKACATLTKPNGKLFFSTINRNLKSYALAIVGAEYLLNWLPKGTHDYAQFIRPSELTRWAETAQLRLLDITGIRYRPLKNEFDLSRDVSVNYLACFANSYE